MPDRRSFLFGAASTVALLATTCVSAAATSSDAEKFVKNLIDEAIAILKLPADQKSERKSGLAKLLDADFDLPTITRLVVGRYWRRADSDQRSNFAREFRRHIVNVYSSQLGVYKNDLVTIKKVVPRNERDTIVFTEVDREDDPPLRLDWLVRRKGGVPRVVDVAAEGVSMMTTKRSEFTAVIAREGIDGLINRLSDLNRRAEADDPES